MRNRIEGLVSGLVVSLEEVVRGVRHPALLFIAATVLASAAVNAGAATPGLPFTEDFAADNLKDPGTTANWSTAEQKVYMAWRHERYNAFGPETVGTDIASDICGTQVVTLGDVNGDGNTDVVIGNSGCTNRLYLNNGTADPFNGVSGTDITADVYNARDIALGDVDRDGDLDIVVANLNERNRLYLNNGTASPFNGVTGTDITTDAHATRSIALGDMDGDGDLDLVAGNSGGVNRLYLNNGTSDPFGGVTGADITGDTHSTWSIALGDLDADGDLDVVAGNSLEPNRLYLNNGTADPFNGVSGTDITTDAFGTGSVALGDMDGDGDIDVVTGGTSGALRLYPNNGTADPFSGVSGAAISGDANATWEIAVGDVDGDGDLDLVAGNRNQPNRLYLNNGTATPFNGVSGRDVTADARETFSIALGDVDGDGDPDLVEGNNNQVNRLYLNKSTANPFTGVSGADITADAHETYAAAVGDVDGDGDLDVVAGNYGQTSRLYLNNGTADPFNVVAGTDITADVYLTMSIALGDVDGDGDLDVVTGNREGQPTRLYLNNGTADPFSGVTGTSIAAESGDTLAIALGDLDGDGDLDVVAGNWNGNSVGLKNRLYLNNGTAAPFNGVTGTDISADAYWTHAIALGDVDGDGDLDVVAGNHNQANRLYLNNGTAAPFSGVTGTDITADAHATSSIALGDVDGDGDLDVVAGNFWEASRLYLNNGTAAPFSGVTGIDINTGVHSTMAIALGDMDRDGDLDVVTGNYLQANRLYLNNGGATPFSEATGADFTAAADDTQAIALGDVDGDGGLDIVAGISNTVNRLYLSNGTPRPFNGVAGSDITTDAGFSRAIALGDVDGDGDLDVVAGNENHRSRLYLHNGTADSFAGVGGTDISADTFTTTAVALGDVDGDGDLDVVTGNFYEPNRLYLNNGTSAPFDGVVGTSISAPSYFTRAVALGDVDGDGDLDLVVGNFGGGDRLYLNNGTTDPFGGVGGTTITADDFGTQSIALGDLDGDGDLDVVAGNMGSPNRLYLNNGSANPFGGVSGSDISADIKNAWGIALGDVDGDGDLDVVVGNSDGANRLFLNNGTATPFNGVDGSDITADSLGTHAVALEDVDADGDLDVVAGNAGQPSRLYLNNGTAAPFAGVDGANLSADVSDTVSVALGDIDADGSLDMVVGNAGVGQINRLYRRALRDVSAGIVKSLAVDTEAGTIWNAKLTPSAAMPPNTSIDWYLTNNGGAQWHKVRPSTVLVFPSAGSDLRWKAETHSLSPRRSPVISQVQLQMDPSDTVPDQFTFTDQTGRSLSTSVVSSPITVTGINELAPISVSAAEYSVDGGAYTAASGTVANGSVVTVRVTSAATYATTVDATLTIGGVSDTFSVTTANDLNSGRLAFYPFTGNANDESGNGHHGTVNGATLTVDRNGVPNQAYAFNGSSFIDLGALGLDYSEFTLSVWFKTDNWVAEGISSGTLISDKPCDWCYPSSGWVFWLYQDEFSFLVNQNASITSGFMPTFKDVWAHLVFTKDPSGQTKVIINGTEAGSYVTHTPWVAPVFPEGEGVELGRKWWDGWYFKGAMDDVGVYSRALSIAEVRSLYADGAWQATQTLTVAASGTGAGFAYSDIPGISCGADCEENYNTGSVVILTASADAGSRASWTDCLSLGGAAGGTLTNATCTIPVSAAHTLHAAFDLIDTTPDPFAFFDQTGVPLSQVTISNEITVQGINMPVPISITGGEYSVNGGGYTASSGTVVNGDRVTVRVTAAATCATASAAELGVNGVSDTFSVTTEIWPYTSSLVAHYPFNGNANDETGNGHDATIHGAVLVADRLGNPNKAYAFDGSSSYLDFSSEPPIGSANTLSMWINPTALTTGSSYVFYSDAPEIRMAITGSGAEARIVYGYSEASSWHEAESVFAPAPGGWYHLVGVKDGSPGGIRLYVNGVLQPTVAAVSSGSSETGSMSIGRYSGPIPDGYFNGIVDDMSIYDRALTPLEVQVLFREGGYDLRPDQFTFIDQAGVALSTITVSNQVTIAGITVPAPISIAGGEYAVNGGEYTTASGTVTNGSQVTVRATSAAAFATVVGATLTVGGVSDRFSVTTMSATAGVYKLSDTGGTKCTQNLYPWGEITCPGTGQDGAYDINPRSFTDNGDGTVTDNNTGLVWQQQDDGVTYDWYRASGTYDPANNPEMQNVCDSLTLAGATDWRLPSRRELLGLVDYGVLDPLPTIGTSFFPNTKAANYWSSTSAAGNPGSAWPVHFDYSFSNSTAKVDAGYVRCVRGRRPDGALHANGNGTVTDGRTGLIWQRNGTHAHWGEAVAYCENLTYGGSSDWRLPNVNELVSLVDETRQNPSVDTTVFPTVGYSPYNGAAYWSSTSCADVLGMPKLVAFDDGRLSHGSYKNEDYQFLCVRNFLDGLRQFAFTDQIGMPLGWPVASNAIPVIDIATPVPISIAGGEYSVNGGAYTSAAGTVANGDVVTVRVITASSTLTTVDATLTIGGLSDTFSVTTAEGFAFFDDFQSYPLGSNPTWVYDFLGSSWGGPPNPQPVDLFRVGTVGLNQALMSDNPNGWHHPYLNKLLRTEFAYGEEAKATFNCNGACQGMNVVLFDYQADNSGYYVRPTSDLVIADITQGSWTALASVPLWQDRHITTVSHRIEVKRIGDVLRATVVRLDTNEFKTVEVTTTKYLGGRAGFGFGADVGGAVHVEVDDFYVRGTLAGSPSQFAFVDQTGIGLSTSTVSNTITASGITTATPIAIAGGEYSINGGAWTSALGSVVNGDTVIVRVTSAATYTTTVDATLTIGGVTDTFSVTTGGNTAPVLGAIGNKTVEEAATLAFAVSATDTELDGLTYSATGMPTGATLDPSTGAFSWTPTYAQAGTYPVTFQVSDGSLTDSEAVTIAVTNAAYESVTVLGSLGSAIGQLNNPQDVEVDSLGNIVVADTFNDRIHIFGPAPDYLPSVFGWYGTGPGQFDNPNSVAMGPGGDLFVLDILNSRVQKFDSNWNYLLQWAQPPDPNLAVDTNGDVYVARHEVNAIGKYTASGTPMTSWGASNPWGVATDSGGNVYVTEYYSHHVKKFGPTGTLLATWGSAGSGNGQFTNPTGIAVDGAGSIYVAEAGNHRIQKLDSSGNYISKWGSYGSAPGQLNWPAGIALDVAGNLYVAEIQNNRIQIFRPYDPLNEGLVAEYLFSGNALDSSGNHHDGTVSGAVLASDRFGNANAAYRFDGSGSNIDLPLDSFSPTNLTFSAWINPGTLGTRKMIVGKLTGFDTSGNVALELRNDILAMQFNNGDTYETWHTTLGSTSLVVNTWYHVAATYDGSELKVFLNGVLDGSLAYSQGLGANTIPWMIGVHASYDGGYWPGFTFEGLIDDVRVYNRALSGAEIVQLAGDRSPEAFTFADQTGVALSTTTTSNAITVSGISAAAPISISGGEYSIAGINGGAYTSAPGTVLNGDQVTVRVTSAATYATTLDATLTIGGVSDTFSVTTIPVDITPDPFTFNDLVRVAPGVAVTSNTITVSGIAAPSPISVTGGEYSVEGGAYTAAPGTVAGGAKVTVRVTAAPTWSTKIDAILTIGGVIDTFSATTAADADSVGFVAHYRFDGNANDSIGVNHGDLHSMAWGMDRFGLAGKAATFNQSASYVRVPSAPDLELATEATWSFWMKPAADINYNVADRPHIFGKGAAYYERYADYAFSVEPAQGFFETAQANNTRTYAGSPSLAGQQGWVHVAVTYKDSVALVYLNGGSPVQKTVYSRLFTSTRPLFIGCRYLVNGVPYAPFKGEIDDLRVYSRALSGAEVGMLYQAERPDATPDAFSFVDQTGVAVGTPVFSNAITIAGVNAPTPIAVEGGEYSINGAAYTAAAGTVTNGDQVTVRVSSSARYATTVDATVTIGGVSDIFSVTTLVIESSTWPVVQGYEEVLDGDLSNWVVIEDRKGPEYAAKASIAENVSGVHYVLQTPSDWVRADSVLKRVFRGNDVRFEVSALWNGQGTVEIFVTEASKVSSATFAAGTATYYRMYLSSYDTPYISIYSVQDGVELSRSDLEGNGPYVNQLVNLTITKHGDDWQFLRDGNLLHTVSFPALTGRDLVFILAPHHSFFKGGTANFDFSQVKVTVEDSTPDPFTFSDQTGVGFSTTVASNTVTLSGFNMPVPISVGGGEYSINGGAYTSTPGAALAGDQVTLRATSAPAYLTRVDTTLTVGGISDTWGVTTLENPVNHPPTDLTLTPASVPENEPAGIAVGALSAVDQDAGDTFTYTLVSGAGATDNGSFLIAGSSLRTAAAFDYETKKSLSVRVRAADQAGLSFEKAFTVSVTNVNEGPIDIGAGMFYDDFASDLGKWTPFGSPQPQIVGSVRGRTGVFDNLGDPNFNSGAVSKHLVGGADGFSIESEVYLDFGSLAGCWSAASVGLTKVANPAFGSSGQNEEYGILFSLDAVGDACWGTPSNYRRHAYLSAQVYAEDGTYESAPAYAIGGDAFANTSANGFSSGWHLLKVQVDADRSVKFLVDGAVVWSPAKKIHPSLLEGRNIVLGSRSSGSAGKAYHDWVKATPAGAQPLLLVSRSAVGGADADLYTMRADGSEQRLVHDSAGRAVQARWSKAGDRVVFSSTAISAENPMGVRQIFSMAADGSDLRQLTTTTYAFGSWLPRFLDNDAQIWFLSGSTSGKSDIHQMAADGTGLFQVTHTDLVGAQVTAFDHALDVAGGGPKVFFTKQAASSSPSAEISSAYPDFTGESRLTTNGVADVITDLSPDGTQILFHRSENPNGYDAPYNVYAVSAAGGTPRKLTTATGTQGCTSAVWSPDGSRVAVSCFDGLQRDLYVMNADGSSPRKVTDTPGMDEEVSDWQVPGGGAAPAALFVEENRPVGTLVAMLSSADPDGSGSYGYTLVSGAGDADNASFQIAGGDLRTAAVFDYEGPQNVYQIRVRATDEGGLWVEKALTVKVVNVVETSQGVSSVTFAGATFTLTNGGDQCTGSVGTAGGAYRADNNYQILDAQIEDVDADGAGEVVVLARHAALYPAQVAVFGPTCALERRSWHPGHLATMLLHDIDADGTKEILLGGTNVDITGVDAPVALALDGRSLDGEAPPRYGSIGTGVERWYRVLGNAASATIQKLAVSGANLLCNTQPDGSGTEYALRLVDGSLANTPAAIAIGEAVDNATLAFATGGAAGWAGQTEVSHEGGDAARSGMVFDGQSSWFSTTVNGPGQGSYWWKVSSEPAFDFLRFSIDGVLVAQISGETDWQPESWSVDTAGAHVLTWEYRKDDVFSEGTDCGWVDQVVAGALPTGSVLIDSGRVYANAQEVTLTLTTADAAVTHMMLRNDQLPWGAEEPFAPTRAWTLTAGDGPKEVWVRFKGADGNWSPAFGDSILLDTSNLGEAVDNVSLVFATGGTKPWSRRTLVYHSDEDAAQSGVLGNGQVSWFETTVSGNAGSFWWKVSSEPQYDFLRFYVDGKRRLEISGEADWRQEFWSAETPGSHVLRWEYAKDVSIAEGQDAAWVDQVAVGASPTGTISVAGGAASTRTRAVSLSLSAQDTDGLAAMKFSNDQGTAWSDPEPFASTKAWTLSAGDGTKKVHVKYKDGLGNWSSAFNDTIVLDTEGPAGSVTINAGAAGTVGATVGLTLTCADLNGCAEMQLGEDATFGAATLPFATTIAWPFTPGEGTKRIYARFRDGLGNWSAPVSDTIVLDAAPPTVAIASPAPNQTAKLVRSIAGTASDRNLVRVEVKVFDGAYYLRADGGWVEASAGAAPWLPATLLAPEGGTTPWTLDTSVVAWTPGLRYSVRARALDVAGNGAEAEAQFVYGVAESAHYSQLSLEISSDTILQTQTMDLAGKLTRLPDDGTDLTGLEILFSVTDPDNMPVPLTVLDDEAGVKTETSVTTSDRFGHFHLYDLVGFSKKGRYRIQASFAGNGGLAPSASEERYVLVGAEAGYAIIVQGKFGDDLVGLAAHNKSANRAYRTLVDRGFADENIFYFNYDKSQDQDNNGRPDGWVDDVPSREKVRAAVETWASERMRAVPAPLYVILVDHGNRGAFYLEDGPIAPADLKLWLENLEATLAGSPAADEKRIVIDGSCYSGSFIPALSGPGRIVITSAAENEQSYKGPNEPGGRSGEFFLDELFKELEGGASLKKAFVHATERTEIYTRRGKSAEVNGKYGDDAVQHPMLDDDGDGVGTNLLSDDAGDGLVADTLHLGVGKTNAIGNPAEFASFDTNVIIPAASDRVSLGGVVYNNAEVAEAWIEVRDPLTELAAPDPLAPPDPLVGAVQVDTGFEKIFLMLKSNGRWECGSTRTAFDEPCGNPSPFVSSGKYEVFAFTKRAVTGEISTLRRTVVYKDKLDNHAPAWPTDEHSGQAVSLLAPDDGAEALTVLTLDWEDATDTDGDAVTYTVLISKDPAFPDDPELTRVIEGLAQSAAMIGRDAKLEDWTTYHWRVLAIDAYGATTESATRSFTTENTNPGLPGWVSGCVTDAFSGRALGAAVASSSGSVMMFPGGCYSIYGEPVGVSVTASANGYKAKTVGTTIPSATTATVNFALVPEYQLAVTRSGNGRGTVRSNPTGIVCGTDCVQKFDGNARVTLQEIHDPAETIFLGWGGGECPAAGAECTVIMSRAVGVTAHFVAAVQELTVTKSGSGTGDVLVDSGSIAWQGNVGTARYPYDTVVELRAVADEGMYFDGWTGACESFGQALACTVALDDARAVGAEFKATIQELQVTVQGSGSGLVRDDRGYLAWNESGTIGTASLDYGTAVTLRAWADAGSVFGGWDGGDCGLATTCTLSMRGWRKVAAIFAPAGGSLVTVGPGGLAVNGEPFTVKGVVYAPVPIGDDPDLTPYGDYFTSAYRALYDRDLPLLRAMNANAVRLLGWDPAADHTEFLNRAYNGGADPIRVIAGFRIDPGLDIDPVSADNVRSRLKAEFRAMVAAHKEHPAILMWAIGSELNAPGMYGGRPEDLFSLMEEMAKEAHAEDSNHPVTTPLADVDLVATIAAHGARVPSLDLWGANLFRGASFDDLFAAYQAVSTKPLLVTGFGADAFDSGAGGGSGAVDEASQAAYAAALWNEIAGCTVCTGGTVMEYADQWWEGRLADPACDAAKSHEGCGLARASMPDGFDNFEWWGIVDAAPVEGGPDEVTPRAAYDRLRELFWSGASAVRINGGASWTRSAAVELEINAPPAAQQMCVSNDGACSAWVPVAATKAWTLAAADGPKTVTVSFADALGDAVTTPASGAIVLDTAAPVGGTLRGTSGVSQITLDWSGFVDAGSDIGSYTLVSAAGAAPVSCAAGTRLYAGTGSAFTHEGLLNTIYFYRVCARDRAGNVSAGVVWSGKPGRENVVPTGSIVINGGQAATRGAAVTLTLTAEDATPPLQMCISNTTSCATWTAFAPTRTWTLTVGNGTKRVYAWFRDAWGNATPAGSPWSDAITYDTLPPSNGTLTATAVPNAGQVALAWGNFTDGGSGVAGYKVVSAVGAPPLSCAVGTVLGSYDAATTTATHGGLVNALYGYRVCAIDAAGNVSAGAIATRRPEAPEADPPTGTVLVNAPGAAWTRNTRVTLQLEAGDASKPIQMCVSNASTCTAWTAFAATKPWVLSAGNGQKTVNVWLRDTWLNTSAAIPATIGLDATPPTNGVVTATPGTGSIALNWSAGPQFADATSGVAGYKVVFALGAAPASCAAGTEVPGYDGVSPEYLHEGLTNATYGYRVCAVDAAGNVSTGAVRSAKPQPAEDVPPVGTVTINAGAAATKRATVTLTLAADDDSLPLQMCVSNTAACTAWTAFAPTKAWTLAAGSGGKTVNVWFRDTWGNATPVASPFTDTIVLDTVAPVNGTVTGTPGDQEIALSWSGFTDPGSGVASYKAVFSVVGTPATCAAGTPVPELGGTLTTRLHTGLTNGKTYYYRVCAIDNAGVMSTGAVWSGKPRP